MLHALPAPPSDFSAAHTWGETGVAVGAVALLIVAWILTSAIGSERRWALNRAVTWEATRAARVTPYAAIDAPVRKRMWGAAVFSAVVATAAVAIMIALPGGAPAEFTAWQARAATWAEHTYGAVLVDESFAAAEKCTVASTDPCVEAAVLVGGHMVRAQIAYPSGIATLVDPNSGQPFPKIGAAK